MSTIATSVLIAPGPDPYAIRIERCSLRTVIRTRLHAQRLDERLARGANPDGAVELSIRARELHSARHRRRLARRWRRLVTAAAAGPHPFDATVPVDREAIHRAGALIEALARMLESGEPLDPTALARARLLLHDPCSPVYAAGARDLSDTLRSVTCALALGPLVKPVDDE